MNINDTVSKGNKVNYKTKSFKVIETFGYNGADLVKTLRAIDMDVFTQCALNFPLLAEKALDYFQEYWKALLKKSLIVYWIVMKNKSSE